MKIKKILSSILATTMVALSMVGCGSEVATVPTSTSSVSQSTLPIVETAVKQEVNTQLNWVESQDKNYNLLIAGSEIVYDIDEVNEEIRLNNLFNIYSENDQEFILSFNTKVPLTEDGRIPMDGNNYLSGLRTESGDKVLVVGDADEGESVSDPDSYTLVVNDTKSSDVVAEDLTTVDVDAFVNALLEMDIMFNDTNSYYLNTGAGKVPVMYTEGSDTVTVQNRDLVMVDGSTDVEALCYVFGFEYENKTDDNGNAYVHVTTDTADTIKDGNTLTVDGYVAGGVNIDTVDTMPDIVILTDEQANDKLQAQVDSIQNNNTTGTYTPAENQVIEQATNVNNNSTSGTVIVVPDTVPSTSTNGTTSVPVTSNGSYITGNATTSEERQAEINAQTEAANAAYDAQAADTANGIYKYDQASADAMLAARG